MIIEFKVEALVSVPLKRQEHGVLLGVISVLGPRNPPLDCATEGTSRRGRRWHGEDDLAASPWKVKISGPYGIRQNYSTSSCIPASP
jgi:hypothetical protein